MNIRRMIDRSMTVEDFINELQGKPMDARVVFASDYGDHGHTKQALFVTDLEEVPFSRICETAYSNSRLAIRRDSDEDDEDSDKATDDDDDECKVVVVIR